MVVQKPLLSEMQWQMIEPLLPKPKRRKRGRPPKDNRRVFEGILWVLKTGALA
jgi:transposase